MKKRKAWNTRIKTNGGYSFYKGSRWSPVAGLMGSIVLGIFSMGFGQVKEMITTWNDVNQAQAHISNVVVIEKREQNYTEKQQILDYIIEVFGDDSADAITIINKCENHAFNPGATNWNRNGTWDAGIFQINEIHGYSIEQMKDWKQNIDAAKKIFDGRGWSAWSCSHVINIKSFWQ